MVHVKICCIASVQEARAAAEAGATAIGLVSSMPSGPGVITDQAISEIAAAAPAHLEKFLLTSAQQPRAIADQVARAGVDTVQICDEVELSDYDRLRALAPTTTIVQVIHVGGPESIAEARRVAPRVDRLLLDSGDKSLTVKELGGTGRVHDWAVSAQIVQAVDVPVHLAGGLTAENVTKAIATVRPFGVDLCSGVRTSGRLDLQKLGRFMDAAQSWRDLPELAAPEDHSS